MKQVELLVLAALAEEPSHGYAFAQRVAELTHARVEIRPGNLYRVPARLERRGLVRETSAPDPEGDDERRRRFGLTRAGRRAIAAELGLCADILARTRGLRKRLADG